MTLYDASGTVPITRLGKQYINVQVKMPEGLSAENLHVVTLDQDGQLEAVEHRVTELEDGNYGQSFFPVWDLPVYAHERPGGCNGRKGRDNQFFRH